MSRVFSATSRNNACFPEKFPSVPIPGKISRFPEQFWLCPETAFVRVVTPRTCKQHVIAHLLDSGVIVNLGRRFWNPEFAEKELTINRAGHFDFPEDRIAAMSVCPKHRRELIANWRGRKSATRCYTLHEDQHKQLNRRRKRRLRDSKDSAECNISFKWCMLFCLFAAFYFQ